jgi:hypothetical protein
MHASFAPKRTTKDAARGNPQSRHALLNRRSGTDRDRVRLRFTRELAARLEPNEEVEFEGSIPEDAHADLLQLAEYF